MRKDIVFEDGGENVFEDIGVRAPEESRLRADLALKIARIIGRRHLRQNEVADILGVDQAKVSKLVRGKISGFTSDRLFRYLEALGCTIKIQISEGRSARAERGHIEVVDG